MRKLFQSIFGGSSEPQQIRIFPQDVTVTVGKGQTLLEAALANGVPYPHNCTVGTCAACKTKLKEGRVREATPFGYTLSKQELDAGYILACQAFPRDPVTVVEVPSPGADLPPPAKTTGRITATKTLTHDILKVTVKTDKPVDYVAGQYASFTAAGLPRARHYSFADAPQRGGRSDLNFFIRKVPGGKFTELLFSDQLNGVALDIEAPQGSFYLRGGNATMLCVAGGSGLAPLLSILDDARKNRIRRPCVLLFGARTQADLYMLDAIKNLGDTWLEKFNFVPVLSHEPEGSDWTGARGLVTEFIAKAAEGFEWKQAEAYMCGPPPMIDAAITKLTDAGVSIDDIHYDKFVDGRDEPAAS
jgi:NAD(P)H-flavin reductase/ferredoxin